MCIKVLFVSSGNSSTGISPIIRNQGESLIKNGVDLAYFTIKGKGINGYLKAVPHLRKYLKENNYNLIHAHYSLSALVATLAGAKPLVVSLMGSDVKSKRVYKFFIKIFYLFFWSKTIVKSEDMKKALQARNVIVIPNGVDLDKFKPIDKYIALKETEWDASKKHILFAANPNRAEKKFELAKEAFDLLNNKEIELHYLENVPNDNMPYYHNAADVVLLTSIWEGSPNVIKEAMACNCPIVSTDVGDVKNVISRTKGCYLTSFKPNDVANNIGRALVFGKRTNGRVNINHLESGIIAKRIISLYQEIVNSKK